MSLKRDPAQARAWRERSKPLGRGKPLKRKTAPKRRKAVSPASPEQRAKVRDAYCIISGERGCDPMHLWDRSLGGCDDPLCVVPATREVHRAYDAGELDVLPALLAGGYHAEIAHVIAAHKVSPRLLLERLTGDVYVPLREEG